VGMEAEQKGGKQKDFLVPRPEKKTGWMAQTPQAGTGDSVGQFRCYHCSNLIYYDSNVSMCDIILKKMLPPNNRESLPTPKENYDLNLNAITLRIWSFQTRTSFFGTKELYRPGLLPSPHPEGGKRNLPSGPPGKGTFCCGVRNAPRQFLESLIDVAFTTS